ncbi:MAG: hypothetical protein NT150_13740 [Bacteroidetes bacterium]|nr:hypothetical protein [Bacteroidota bacterium]
MKKFESAFAFCVILILGILFQHSYINDFPSHTHAWAQSDRYALSIGFVENNLDFFHPQTYVLNRQFPGNFEVPSAERITAVNFPIHDYIPAIFMKLFNTNAPCIFRGYILLYSFAALFFLFQLTQLLTKDFFKSLLVLLFAACSPVFVYYQSGFLPTIPSLANAIIGLHFYVKYLQDGRQKNLYVAIGFLLLGALARTTFVLPLIAVFGLEILRSIKKEIAFKSLLLAFPAAALILFTAIAYQNHMQFTYGSLFLNQLLPAKTLHGTKEIVKDVYNNWSTQYFTAIHYMLLSLVLLGALLQMFKSKAERALPLRSMGIFLTAYFVGCVLFAIAMLRQFPAHDYYFLDSFFLPALLFLILLLARLPHFNRAPRLATLALLLVGIPLAAAALHTQKLKRESGSWDRVAATTNNFEGSAEFLDQLKIKRNATILVIDAYAPNIPFVLMQRKGFAVMTTTKENLLKALQWKYDYIVVQNEFFVTDVYLNCPEILTRIKKIADNGKISVCALSNVNQSLHDFIGIENKELLLHEKFIPGLKQQAHWHNRKSTKKLLFENQPVGFMTPTMDYGIAYKSKNIPLITQRDNIVLISSYFFSPKQVNCEIAVSVVVDDEGVFNKTFRLKNLLKKNGQWEKIDLPVYLPKITKAPYEFFISINNVQHDSLYYHDFEFKIY